ncbi:ABC transporter ATP-binding protein [Parafrankia sp. BMG5.11]|uniref:ABC transporter ATP-binding protein n=1 Tax=Parafrankia sp. BMG5.11 TaxID=222540 RepID=UPI001039E61C|nr:ATP-binding cassette domain-containing protein [Parafrankia sp. BMG5.11]TCJ31349.1 ATP-binding cassette domain-containing protein [Parafrankia sp. BMG5.11]
MIEARGLTKRYGEKVAVDDLTFTVRPGIVTGFLGPNGAGKSTTMRMILGLDTPSGGSVTVNGRPYREHTAPLREAGALLEARSVHPGRAARLHLLALARSNGIRRSRVDDVIDAVGLREVASRWAGGFSLGMSQRLGIATALLGDPRTVILDEPLNGLDTEGIRWLRSLLRELAVEGRTVFVSSHLMNEMALTAQHLVVIGRGRLIADTTVAEFVGAAARGGVLVRCTAPDELARRLRSPEVRVETAPAVSGAGAGPGAGAGTVAGPASGGLLVTGLSTDQVGMAAAAAGITVLELTARQASLEEAFMRVTHDAVAFRPTTMTDRPTSMTGGQR